MTKKEKTEFIVKLKKLLKKYNCYIEFTYDDCSDMMGVYGERMEIVENKRSGDIILSIPGLDISPEDF